MRRLIGILLACAAAAAACDCRVAGPVREAFASTPLVFVGTVTDMGPTEKERLDQFHSRLSAAEWADLHSGALPRVKRAWKRLLPAETHAGVDAAATPEEVTALAAHYYPEFGGHLRPVRFVVEETFKGGNAALREVWTGQGDGDCGFGFAKGRRYVVFARYDPGSRHYWTGLCSYTGDAATARAQMTYLRSTKKGNGNGRSR